MLRDWQNTLGWCTSFCKIGSISLLVLHFFIYSNHHWFTNHREAFPTLTVEDVTLAYDIKQLTKLDAERDCAEQARLYCENYNTRKGPLKMYPQPCGQVVGCCFKQVSETARSTLLFNNRNKSWPSLLKYFSKTLTRLNSTQRKRHAWRLSSRRREKLPWVDP